MTKTKVMVLMAAASAVIAMCPVTAMAKDVKLAVIFGVGGLGDQSFSDMAYEGLEKAKDDLGIEFDYAEPKAVTEFEMILRDMSDSGEYDTIICLSYDQVDALSAVAPDYPEQQYAIVDAAVEGDNIVSYSTKEEEGSFLVGALAAYMKQDAENYDMLTDNGEYGFVGAQENSTINKFAAGYQAGVKYVDEDAEVLIQYVGGDNPFGDTTTAKEIAASQISKGCDIIFPAAGGAGLGVFAAAEEADTMVFGVNSNQNSIDPDHIVASMLKRVDTAAYEIAEDTMNDTLKLGTEITLGLKDKGIDYTLEDSNIEVSDEILNKVEELRDKIISGEIEVPSTLE